MNESKWIRFVEESPAGWVTRFWMIEATAGGAYLGCVKWWRGWRRYCFFPSAGTIFEQDCLREIANFCESETTKRKAERLAGDGTNSHANSTSSGETKV